MATLEASSAKSVIDSRLNNMGQVIIDAAKEAGLDLALACAIVEQESQGQNIFGCDLGDVGDNPPYCGQRVTAPRVSALRDGGSYSHGMNGIGITQLTWWTFVDRAEALGGAHIPANQCKVAFTDLAALLQKYDYMNALEAYNDGDGSFNNPLNNYDVEVANKHSAWKDLLGDVDVEPEWPTVELTATDSLYLADLKDGEWARMPGLPNTTLRTDKDGWLWIPKENLKPNPNPIDPKPDPKPDPDPKPEPKFQWPVANDKPKPNSAWYVERNPTRYSWRDGGRPEIEEWAIWLIQNYDVWVNTYYHHPEEVWLDKGVSREYDSFDVWGSQGRGDPLPADIGAQIFPILFNDPNLPNIEWIIYNATMYGWWNWGGEGFGTDPFSWHYDHIHVTYFPL